MSVLYSIQDLSYIAYNAHYIADSQVHLYF